MATVEVDENVFRAGERLRETLGKIASNPSAKKLLEQAHKLIDANAVTPELDKDEAERKRLGEWEAKFADLQKKVDEDTAKRDKDARLAALNAKFEAGRAALRDAGWTKDAIEGVEKLMEEKGIVDHEIAAAYIEKQSPPADVLSPRSYGAFEFIETPKEDDHFLKALLKTRGDADSAVVRRAGEAIAEVRNSQPRRRF